MIVVSDTAPLNYLLLIGQVELLPRLFGRVLARPSVKAEMLHPDAPEIVRTWTSSIPDWLEVQRPITALPKHRLGAGEAEAIALASEIQADLLLVDERYAKRIAIEHGLHVTGTLGVLELAAQRGLLDLTTAINMLRQTTFRAPAKLIEEVLRRNRKRCRSVN